MAKKKQEKTVKIIEIQKLKQVWQSIPVMGLTPLSVHKLPYEPVGNPQLDATKGEGIVQKKKALSMQECFAASLYWLDKNGNLQPDGKDPLNHKWGFGFRASGFKSGAVDAIRQVETLSMEQAKRLFFIFGAKDMRSNFVKITGVDFRKPAVPEIECEFGNNPGVWVRIGKGKNKTPQIRYRATFKVWTATLWVMFNPDWISREQIVNLINMGGNLAGLGENRPGKSGNTSGMYRVGTK